MDDIYEKISIFNSVFESKCSESDFFEVTELWRQESTGVITEFSGPVFATNLSTWLAEESRITADGQHQSLVLRLVWAKASVSNRVISLSLSEPMKTKLLDTFGLNLAFNYFSTSINGIDEFPRHQGPIADQQSYAFCYMPKLAAIWSHKKFRPPSVRAGATYGIVLAEDSQQKNLKKLLKSSWHASLPGHAMYPAFLFSFLLGTEIDRTQAGLKPRIHEVELRTGYYVFKTKRPEKAATGQLGQLSAEMSGSATKLASVQRKGCTLDTLMEFVMDALKAEEKQSSPSEGDVLLKHHIGVLQQRLKMQMLDTEYTLKRVHIQIEALVNLIAQSDSMRTIDISRSSYRDALSMKTLAVVTMFYLPGSFISALFSTPCFDWDNLDFSNKGSIGVTPTPQFKLYWAVTIPLTLLTFVLYFVWLYFQKMERVSMDWFKGDGAKENNSLSSGDGSDMEMQEVKLQSRRRQTSGYM